MEESKNELPPTPMFTDPSKINHFAANMDPKLFQNPNNYQNPKLHIKSNDEMNIIEKPYKEKDSHDGQKLINDFSAILNSILNVTFKGMIAKIKDEPDTLQKYPLSVQNYYI